MRKLIAVLMLVSVVGSFLMPTESRADGHYGDRHHGDHWRHGDHHGGSWHHGWHNGHLGWWFALAGTWYAVNRAAYEAQAEPVVVEQPVTVYAAPPAPASSPYWYYCRSTNSYYPYVSSCSEGWQQVAATPIQ